MPPSKKPEDIIRRALDKQGFVHYFALNEVLTYKNLNDCKAILEGKKELSRKDINYLKTNLGLTREDLGLPDKLLGDNTV